MIETISKFIGIFSSLLMIISFVYCVRKNHHFNFRRHTLSYLGTTPETAFLFNSTIISIAILRSIYLGLIMKSFIPSANPWIILLLLLVFASMFMVGFIPLNSHPRIHEIFGYLLFSLSFIWLISFHFVILSIGQPLSLIGRIVAIIFIGGTITLFLKFKQNSLPEIFFIFMTFIWDVYMLFLLLSNHIGS